MFSEIRRAMRSQRTPSLWHRYGSRQQAALQNLTPFDAAANRLNWLPASCGVSGGFFSLCRDRLKCGVGECQGCPNWRNGLTHVARALFLGNRAEHRGGNRSVSAALQKLAREDDRCAQCW